MAQSHFISFDVPGSTGTYAASINSAGTIAGTYGDSTGIHGFVRSAAGVFTTFDVPDSTSISVVGINDSGTVTGEYNAASSSGLPTYGGFVRNPNGVVTTFNVSLGGALSPTVPNDINSAGVVVGLAIKSGGGEEGFLWQTGSSRLNNLVPSGINGSGATTGMDGDKSFIQTAGGHVTTFSVPGSVQTVALKINNAGTIVGYWFDSGSLSHGFIRKADGSIVSLSPPHSSGTSLVALNSSGVSVGTFQVNGPGTVEGLVAYPSGAMTVINVPGALETLANGINDADFIVGGYTDASYVQHGFVLAPSAPGEFAPLEK
jgi:hypothetical protein